MPLIQCLLKVSMQLSGDSISNGVVYARHMNGSEAKVKVSGKEKEVLDPWPGLRGPSCEVVDPTYSLSVVRA